MIKFSLPLTQLIHEKLSIIMTFVFSRQPLEELIKDNFKGYWKYLNKAIFEISEQRAEKACLELAMFLRLLDNDQKISEYIEQRNSFTFGRLIKNNKPGEVLSIRDVCNKIIHASDFIWDFPNKYLICNSQEPDKWIRAEIEIISLAALCGELIS